MNLTQCIACSPSANLQTKYVSLSSGFCQLISTLRVLPTTIRFLDTGAKIMVHVSPSPKRRGAVCLFGGQGKQNSGSEGNSPWKAVEKFMGSFKKEITVQDVLREQTRKQQFDGNGGSGNGPGSGGDGSGDAGDEGIGGILDELLQVVLATIAFIFLYVYMLDGEELTLLVKDYIKYLFGKKPSVRLREAMYLWGLYFAHKKEMRQKKVKEEGLIELAILGTPTWWHDSEEMRPSFKFTIE